MREFVPSTGRLTAYRPPASGRQDTRIVRVDSGVVEGGEISIHYDPMIAKLVTHAPDRAGAIAAQADALDGFVLDGIRHNIPFLASLMAQQRWREGRLSTRFIAEEYPGGFTPAAPDGAIARAFVAVALSIDHALDGRRSAISGRTRPHPAYAGRRVVLLGKTRHGIEVGAVDGLAATFDDGDRLQIVSAWRPGDRIWTGTINGRPMIVAVRPVLNGYDLAHGGCASTARVLSARQAELVGLMLERDDADDQKALLCPMPGLVKAIDVKVGQAVKAGEALCLVEAMKMENVLRAERDVTIKSIEAKEGDSLAVDAPIMTFA